MLLQHLLLGFELGVYAPHEHCMLFWCARREHCMRRPRRRTGARARLAACAIPGCCGCTGAGLWTGVSSYEAVLSGTRSAGCLRRHSVYLVHAAWWAQAPTHFLGAQKRGTQLSAVRAGMHHSLDQSDFTSAQVLRLPVRHAAAERAGAHRGAPAAGRRPALTPRQRNRPQGRGVRRGARRRCLRGRQGPGRRQARGGRPRRRASRLRPAGRGGAQPGSHFAREGCIGDSAGQHATCWMRAWVGIGLA